MSTDPRPTAYDISVSLHAAEVDAEPFDVFGAGASMKVLRRLRDGGLRSGLVTFPAGWRGGGALRAAAAVQIFVRSGAITLAGKRLAYGGFVVVPAGAVLPALASADGAEAIVILDDQATFEPVDGGDGAIITEDVFAVAPIVPVINGRVLEGFERRVLWEDAATGADTRLLRVPAGFEGTGGPSFHPVEEEIFCLEGDIAPDDVTPLLPGSYLWNPRFAVHGFHEHSRTGCLLLEWHDGLWAFHRYEGVMAEV